MVGGIDVGGRVGGITDFGRVESRLVAAPSGTLSQPVMRGMAALCAFPPNQGLLLRTITAKHACQFAEKSRLGSLFIVYWTWLDESSILK